eukprot:1832711-Ditylum_brightwellii.AAC.2
MEQPIRLTEHWSVFSSSKASTAYFSGAAVYCNEDVAHNSIDENLERELMEHADIITEIWPLIGASLLPPPAPPPLTPLNAPDVELP